MRERVEEVVIKGKLSGLGRNQLKSMHSQCLSLARGDRITLEEKTSCRKYQ